MLNTRSLRVGPQVPNSNYCAFEDWVMPVLGAMLREQQGGGARWTPSKARPRTPSIGTCIAEHVEAVRAPQGTVASVCVSTVGSVCMTWACLTSPAWLQCCARQSTSPDGRWRADDRAAGAGDRQHGLGVLLGAAQRHPDLLPGAHRRLPRRHALLPLVQAGAHCSRWRFAVLRRASDRAGRTVQGASLSRSVHGKRAGRSVQGTS